MVAVENFALELLPGQIHRPDLFDRFFYSFQKPTTIEIEGIEITASPNGVWQENPTRARLLFDGNPLRAEVEGIELIAQFRHARGYILIAAYDWFDGEDTYIYFLTFDFVIRDEIHVGGGFHLPLGFAANFQIISENQLNFSIDDDDRTWQLTVLDRPRRTFFGCSCGEIKRPLKWLLSEHYLKLEIK